MSDSPGDVVGAGYVRIGDRYVDWAARIADDPRDRFVAELEARLETGAQVIDLGCGAGVPTGSRLAERFTVLGIDVSAAQLDLPDASFDAVVALYSITHVPREAHPELFQRIARWLRPGGLFLAALGARGGEDWLGEWLGVEMFFSSWDAATNRRLLRDAGLRLVLDDVVTMHEPEGPATFFWALARRLPLT